MICNVHSTCADHLFVPCIVVCALIRLARFDTLVAHMSSNNMARKGPIMLMCDVGHMDTASTAPTAPTAPTVASTVLDMSGGSSHPDSARQCPTVLDITLT